MKRKSFKFLSLLSPIVLVVFCMLVGVSFLTTKNTPVLANQIPNMATSQTDQTENLEQTTQSEFETWVNFVMSEKSGVGGDGTVFAQNANKDLKISGNVINVYSEVGLAIISAHSNGLFSDGITSSISNITIDSNLTDTTFSGYTISLEADLNLYGKYWTPIGTSENKFAGKFIGNGHKISGVMIDSLISGDAKALFGYCDSTAVIADLLVTDCIGAESGIAYSGETGAIITGCYTDCYNICGTDDSNNNISIDNLNNAWKNIDSAIGVNSHYVEWYLDDEKLQGEVTLGTPTIEGNVHTVEFTSSSVMLTDVTIASITFELFDYTSYSASTGTFSRELSSITKELTVDNQEESYNYQKESYNQYRLTFNEGQGSRGGIADFNPSISTDPSSSTNKNTFKTTFSTTHQTALKVTITLAYRQVDAPSLSYYTLNESKITAEYQQLNGSYFYDDEYLNKLNTGTYVVGIWQKNTSVPEGKFTYANTAQGTGGVYRIKDKINITNASGYSAYVNVTTDSEKFLSNGSSLDSNSYVEINSSGQEINISIVNIFSVTLNNGNISFNGTKFETDTKSPNVIAYVIDTGLNGTREGKDTPLFIYNDYSGVPNIKKTTLVVTSSSSSTFGSADNTLEAVTTFEKDETYDCYWGMNTINYTLICNGGIIAYALVNPYANSGNGAIVDGVTINNGDNSIPFSFVLVAYYTGVVYQYINVTATNCGNDIINRSALVNVGGTYKSVGENILYYDSVIDALIGVNNRYVEISALTDNREKEEKYEFTLNNITATIKIIDKTANIYGTASGLGTNIIFNNIEYLVSDFTVSTDAEGKRQGEYSITYKFDKNIIDINCGDLTLVDFSINGLIVDEVIPTNGTSIMTNYIDSDVNDYRKKWTLSKFLSLNMKIEFTINGEEFTTTSDKIQIKLDPTQTTMDYVDAGFVSQERNVFHYTYSSKYGFPYYIYYSKHKWETDSTICYFSNNGESEGISETNFIPGKVEKDNAIKSTNGIFKIYYETKVVQVDGELPLYVLDLSIVFLQNYTGSKLTFKVDFVAVNFDYNINFEQQGDYKQGDYNYIDEYDESLNISYSQYTSKNLYVSFNDSTSYAKYVNLYSGRNESTYFADSDTYTTGGSLFFDGRLKSTTVENNKAVEIKYEYIAVKKLVSSSYKYDHKLTYSIIVYKDNLTTALNTIKIRGVSSNYINYVFNGNQRLTYDVRSICSVEIENQALKLNLINTDSILTYYYVYKYKPTTGYAIGDFDFFGNTSETTGNVEFRYQDYAGTSKTGYVTFKPIEITANVSYGYDNNGSVSEINSELLTDKNAVVSTGAFNVENDLILKAPEIDYHTFGYIDSHIFGYYAIKDSNENSNGNYYKLCDESGNVFTSNSDNLSISAELLYCLDSAGNRLKVDLVNNLVTVVATKENSDYSVGDIVNITLNNGGVNIVVVYTANLYKFTVYSFDNNGNVIRYGIEKSYKNYKAKTNISGELF